MDKSKKWTTTFLLLVIVKCVDLTSDIKYYENYCGNEAISLATPVHGNTYYAALLKFSFPLWINHVCSVSITAPPGFSILYQIHDLVLCNCSSLAKIVTVTYAEYMYTPRVEKCYSSNSLEYTTTKPTQNDWHEARNAENVDILVNDEPSDIQFKIELYTLHHGDCNSEEIFCGGCIHNSLACSSGDKYCDRDAYQVCSDSPRENTTSSVVAGVITALVFIFLLVIIGCVCVKRDSIPCFKSPVMRGNNSESVAERARAIFTVQLATRGTTSDEDGNDNRAYTEDGEPIDPSLLQPPPEYSSLENIDQIGKSEIDGELPPSYSETIENQAKYKVVIDMQDNR